jgi:hypothetical protein
MKQAPVHHGALEFDPVSISEAMPLLESTEEVEEQAL